MTYNVYITCSVRLWPCYHVYHLVCCSHSGELCITFMTAMGIWLFPHHIIMFIWCTTSNVDHTAAYDSEQTHTHVWLSSLKSESEQKIALLMPSFLYELPKILHRTSYMTSLVLLSSAPMSKNALDHPGHFYLQQRVELWINYLTVTHVLPHTYW